MSERIEEEMFDRQQDIKLIYLDYAIVVGVGGIGSWVALNMALTGRVERLFLIDSDTVESSNLNRTPFRICDIGYFKVDALKYLILERRIIDITTYQQKTNLDILLEIAELTYRNSRQYIKNSNQLLSNGVIIDCRDDVYTDMYEFPFKYYKVGYDGLSATIDGNPRNTAVWGRANGYQHTPSFICPAQLAANLVVTDILTIKEEEQEDEEEKIDTLSNTNPFDFEGRLNKVITFNVKDLIKMIYDKVNS